MEEFFSFLRNNNITANGFHALYKLTQMVQQRDEMNFQIELIKLEKTMFITRSSTNEVSLTLKGISVLNEGKKYFKGNKKIKYNLEELKDNIIKFNNYFPKQRREGMALSYRSNPKELQDSFIWFFENYPDYTWDNVFKAVEQYVKNTEDIKYLQSAKYFIKKQDASKKFVSTLADICYAISQGIELDSFEDGYFNFK